MILDISNPDHEVALRWACETMAAVDAGDVVSTVASSQAGKLKLEALATLSSPALATELIRQLVERAGVLVLPFHANADASSRPFVSLRDDAIGVYVEAVHHPQRGDRKYIRVMTTAFPATIAHLFAIPPNAVAKRNMNSADKNEWRSMGTAPMNATEVRVLLPNGNIVERAHWASALSGEEQPPYRGWFKPMHDSNNRIIGYLEIETPIRWMPCAADEVCVLLEPNAGLGPVLTALQGDS